jgi:hypothetical protein
MNKTGEQRDYLLYYTLNKIILILQERNHVTQKNFSFFAFCNMGFCWLRPYSFDGSIMEGGFHRCKKIAGERR